jgi:hypothetical protein
MRIVIMNDKDKEKVRDIAKALILISFPNIELSIGSANLHDDDYKFITNIMGLLEIIKNLGFNEVKAFNEVATMVAKLDKHVDNEIVAIKEMVSQNDDAREKLVNVLLKKYKENKND